MCSGVAGWFAQSGRFAAAELADRYAEIAMRVVNARAVVNSSSRRRKAMTAHSLQRRRIRVDNLERRFAIHARYFGSAQLAALDQFLPVVFRQHLLG